MTEQEAEVLATRLRRVWGAYVPSSPTLTRGYFLFQETVGFDPEEEAIGDQVLDLLIKATYVLGHELAVEALVAEFGLSLTAHEKAELRLSLPRESWPQKWLDEEEA